MENAPLPLIEKIKSFAVRLGLIGPKAPVEGEDGQPIFAPLLDDIRPEDLDHTRDEGYQPPSPR
jgi:hypothetical protein